eukprot:g2508.t1 g2508   contig12:257467-258729(-)
MATLASSGSSGTAAAFSTTANLAGTTAASVAATSTPIATWVSAFSGNKHLVGSAWIISSALLTTYSTTKFLKYQGVDDEVSTSANKRGFFGFNRIQNNESYESTEKSVRKKSSPKFSRASLLTLYRFSGSLLLGLAIHSQFYNLAKLIPRFAQTLQAAKMFLLPSIFLFIANFSNSIALDRIGISLTYTSKCGIPLITVLFTILLDGFNALPSTATLLSLLPIAFGIGAASWNSPTFELVGFLAALVSTTSQAALNVVSKRVMRKTGIRGAEAQRAMVLVALGIGLIMAGADTIAGRLREFSLRGTMQQKGDSTEEGDFLQQQDFLPPAPAHPPTWLTFLAVLAYHMEYVLSFMFVGLVEPITYGTCDALRRLLIIVAGRQLFGGDKFSKVNLGGIGMALLGALMYSITSANGGGVAKTV